MDTRESTELGTMEYEGCNMEIHMESWEEGGGRSTSWELINRPGVAGAVLHTPLLLID